MRAMIRSGRVTALFLVLVVLGAILLIGLGPTERTLGEGIRVVYLHVALIWTGMLGIVLAGVLALPVLLTGRETLARWLETVAWVALGFYALSGVISLVAQQVNWGGIAWQEPRTSTMLQLLAFFLIVQVVKSWFIPSGPRAIRLKAGLNILMAAVLLWSNWATPLQLHPQDPIGTSSSPGIRLTFYLLFGLLALAATWLVFFLETRDRAWKK